MGKRITTEDFIERSKKIHGDRYDYSLANYVNAKTKTTIICRTHGPWDVIPYSHYHSGSGCPLCCREVRDTESFIEKATKVHRGFYNYDLVNYQNSTIPVEIGCPNGHTFKQSPNSHLSGKGCLKCKGRRLIDKDEFVKRSKSVHGELYNYDKFVYVDALTKGIIICNTCAHEFEQNPAKHYNTKHGCPKCAPTRAGRGRTSKVLENKYRHIKQPEDYKIVPLTQGKFAKVDNEDFDKVKGINWHVDTHGYARSTIYGSMHRFILEPPPDKFVDHISTPDILDNRRSNLRVATPQESCFNTSPYGKSGVKGLRWVESSQKWLVELIFNGKHVLREMVEDKLEATKLFDMYALKYQGEFAWINLPELKEEYLERIEKDDRFRV